MKAKKQIGDRIIHLENEIDKFRATSELPVLVQRQEITVRKAKINALQWVISKK